MLGDTLLSFDKKQNHDRIDSTNQLIESMHNSVLDHSNQTCLLSSSLSSPDSVSLSETEQTISEFASKCSRQQLVFYHNTQRPLSSRRLSKQVSDVPTRAFKEDEPAIFSTCEPNSQEEKDVKTVSQPLPSRNVSHAYRRRLCLLKVMQKYSNQEEPVSLGAYWAEIFPYCVSGYLDLPSILVLRQACTRLYYKRRYAVTTIPFYTWSTLTEQEILTKVLPQLQSFLTPGSFSQLNFSRCCLLTDTFPKLLLEFQQRRLCRLVKALIFDFCYALSDKSLEVLLSTSLPSLEILSLRCARSRDLTGAPFSTVSKQYCGLLLMCTNTVF